MVNNNSSSYTRRGNDGETTRRRQWANDGFFTGVTTGRVKDGMGRRQGNDEFIKKWSTRRNRQGNDEF